MAVLLDEVTRDFSRGAVERAPTAYRRNEARLIHNGRVRADGTVETRGGSARTHATALNSGAQGYGGIEFIKADGTRQWVVFVGDDMFYSEDEGATWTNPSGATALPQDYWSLTTWREGSTNYLLCANGGTNVYEWDGATWATNANYPSGVKFVATFNQRVWFAGHSGNTLRASKILDRDTLTPPDGITLQIMTHDGDQEITGLYQLHDHLLVFKRESTAYVDGYGNSDIIVAAGSLGLSRSVGCVGFRTIQGAGEAGVLWLSERGIEHYVPGGPIRLVSEPQRTFFENLSWSNIFDDPGIPAALYYPLKHSYWVTLPTTSTQNTQTFVYQLLQRAIVFDTIAASDGSTVFVNTDGYLEVQADGTRSSVQVVAGYLEIADPLQPGLPVKMNATGYLETATDDTISSVLFTADRANRPASPIGVGYDGFVRYLDEGGLDDVLSDGTGGTAVGFKLRPRPHLFGLPFHRKRGRVIDIMATASEDTAASVVLIADGREGTTHTITIPASAGDQPTRVKVRVNGRGRTLEVEFRTTGALRMEGIRLAAEPLKEVA